MRCHSQKKITAFDTITRTLVRGQAGGGEQLGKGRQAGVKKLKLNTSQTTKSINNNNNKIDMQEKSAATTKQQQKVTKTTKETTKAEKQ